MSPQTTAEGGTRGGISSGWLGLILSDEWLAVGSWDSGRLAVGSWDSGRLAVGSWDSGPTMTKVSGAATPAAEGSMARSGFVAQRQLPRHLLEHFLGGHA